MDSFDSSDRLTRSELAAGLVDLMDELRIDDINEVLVKNVPYETLQFFAEHADEFSKAECLPESTRQRIPNLMLLGYLLRLLEDRLLPEPDGYDH